LWKEATIVLDTNVLLNLYRLPASARDEFLTALETLKDRLWIPYQVALEFQRNRLTVIARERKSTDEVLSSAQNHVGELRRKVEALQIEKRGLGIDPNPILEDIEKANQKLIAAVEATHKSQYEIASTDSVRERLDALLAGQIGPGPKNQADLDELTSDGEDRFRDNIPPGFADSNKDKNPKEATFIHQHLKYQRKFGDLILWKQLIQQAKTFSLKCVLLVTADRKEDWWWSEQGKTLGPHPELVSEIQRDAGVELFWMYSFVKFVEHADKYTAANISEQSVKELQHVVVSEQAIPNAGEFISHDAIGRYDLGSRRSQGAFSSFDLDEKNLIEDRVGSWVSTLYSYVIKNPRGFPDLIAREGAGVHGYEIKFMRNFARMVMSPIQINSLLRGYLETKEGRLSTFTLVIVIPESEFFEIVNKDGIRDVARRLDRILSKYPIEAIVVGSVLKDKFEVLVWKRELEELGFEDASE
jgi:hypothetical protein